MVENELAIENQNLREVLEVAKQITAELDIKMITKNITYFVRSKFNTWCSFILPKDFDSDLPIEFIYEGSKLRQKKMEFESLKPFFDFFQSAEYNQISFKQFSNDFANKDIVNILKESDPDFFLPLRGESGILGVYVQGKKEDSSPFTIEEIQFLTNVTGFGAISIENANFYRRAITDRMTKLYNHHQFEKTLEEYIQKAESGEINPFSLVLFDIDHFKSFNDTYGHLQGDIIIKDIARILLSEVRECDYPARYGGEEFIVILPDTALDEAERFAQRLRKNIETYEFPGDNKILHCTISLGVAEYSQKYVKNNSDIVSFVDKALYKSKENGRNQVTKFIYNK
ncbi:MAG: GGDEF domain-containing protein [Spirochaetales bacterium]|nr:GGDEF domain-containing protein [Spirochaetales bacterium]